MTEMVEFFNLPYLGPDFSQQYQLGDIYRMADFNRFKETFRIRFRNFVAFLQENNLATDNLSNDNYTYNYTAQDILTSTYLINQNLDSIKQTQSKSWLSTFKQKYRQLKNRLIH